MLRGSPLLKPFATTAGATVIITAASGLTGVIATRALGPYERGLLATGVAWSSVLGSLAAIGVPQAAAHFVARNQSRPQPFAGAALVVAAAAGTALAVGGLIGAVLVGGAAEGPLAILFVVAPSLLAGGAALGAVLGTGDYRTWNILRFLYPGLNLAGVIALSLRGLATAVSIAAVMAAVSLIQTCVVCVVLRRRGVLGRPDRPAMRALIAFGWRSVVTGTAWLISYRLDQLYLSVAAAPSVLGTYAVSASFGEVIVPVAASAGSLMLARVSAGGHAEVSDSLRSALLLAGGTAASIAAVVFVAAPLLVNTLFGSAFRGAVDSVRILMVGAVALSISTVLADTLRGLGQPLLPAIGEVAGVVSSVLLLVWLVPRLGIEGAATASSVSYSIVALTLGATLLFEMKKVPVDV